MWPDPGSVQIGRHNTAGKHFIHPVCQPQTASHGPGLARIVEETVSKWAGQELSSLTSEVRDRRTKTQLDGQAGRVFPLVNSQVPVHRTTESEAAPTGVNSVSSSTVQAATATEPALSLPASFSVESVTNRWDHLTKRTAAEEPVACHTAAGLEKEAPGVI